MTHIDCVNFTLVVPCKNGDFSSIKFDEDELDDSPCILKGKLTWGMNIQFNHIFKYLLCDT